MPFKVTIDAQWEAFKAALANTPKSVNDVKVNANWNELRKCKPSDDHSVSSLTYPLSYSTDAPYQDDNFDEGTQVCLLQHMSMLLGSLYHRSPMWESILRRTMSLLTSWPKSRMCGHASRNFTKHVLMFKTLMCNFTGCVCVSEQVEL